MKRMQAIVAAAIITAILAFGLLGIGVSAAFNTNTTPVSNSPTSATTVAYTTSSAAQSQQALAQINQLESIIAQYQQQLNTASTQVQQLRGDLLTLQQMGVITILSDGSIVVGHR